LICAVAVSARIWWRGHYFEETDNAYLAGHVSAVSARIAGVVTKVLVDENQMVKAGDVLAELDSADQDVRVDQIRAQLAQVDAQIRQVDAQIEQANAEARSVSAQVARAEVQFKRADADASRYISLHDIHAKAVSKMELDAAIAARDSAAADLRAQQDQVRAAHAKIASSESSKATHFAQKGVLAAQLREAELQSSYNKIHAPVSGRVGKKSVEVGARIQPSQLLLAIVQDGVWVTANFKETQLPGVFQGQKARIRIDSLPGREFTGLIDSFSPASGGHFSLLPPDNATGNFTKIVQRIPVKILFDSKDLNLIADRISPGMSAIVEIDLRQGRPATRSAPTVASAANS
jgi:membrane fusion protein, multidrug efflux system